MRKIREILRLKAAGLNIREVAASAGAARTTVYEYLVRAEAAGLSWPLPDDMDDEALEARLFPPATAELARRRPVPDWREVHRELRSGRHVTMRLLWLEWKQDHPDGWGYSQFCWHYQRWLGTQDVVMRLSYRAGERMFVDFSGDKVPVTDPATGEVSQAEVFVAVLGCSGMLYVEATTDQGLQNWLMAHVHAFEAYGGATVATTPDNLKSGVTKACYYEPELNASYAELGRHYGTAILPTRSAHPRDKAAVEAGVLCTERWVLAPLRHRQFFSLAELNEAIRQKVAELNDRAFRGEPTSRRELFEELERTALKPLPERRYELAEWKKVTVNIDYHVEYDKRPGPLPRLRLRPRRQARALPGSTSVAGWRVDYLGQRHPVDTCAHHAHELERQPRPGASSCASLGKP